MTSTRPQKLRQLTRATRLITRKAQLLSSRSTRRLTTTGIKSRALKARSKTPTARLITYSARRWNLKAFPKIGSLAFDSTDTYTINNATDLKALADYVNAGHDCAGYKFKLGGNIEGVNFHIGTSGSKFAGTLDGDDRR